MNIKKLSVALFTLTALLLNCTANQGKNKYIEPGTVWKDTGGNVINAHGGGMLYYDGTYYWYGECKGNFTYRLKWVTSWECWRAEAGGVSCYSSKDLVNWKYEGLALSTTPDDTLSDLHPSQVIERPKVIYNDKTKKFVMWMHIESPDYEKAHAGVAISDTPTGPFTYLGSFKPNGQDSRDQTLFKDDDGRAYHICSSEWNKTVHISLLNDEYTRESGIYTRNFINKSREAPAVFKHKNKYYMITSGCTGWDPNVAEYAVADSMLGNWTVIGNPCTGKDADSTFYAQSTFVFPVEGIKDCFIAMFDRWNKTNLIDSRYIWLPVRFIDDTIEIEWKNKWTCPQPEQGVGLPISSFRTDHWGLSQKTTNYYFDSQTGNDANAGISPDVPFRSLSKIKDLAINPGDSILLKSGAIFTEKLSISAKGSQGKPVVIGKYGGEARPYIKGDATQLEMVHLFNSEYIVVRDLEISNKGERIKPHLTGLLVELHNYGKANDITVDNLFIHNVYGSLIKGEGQEHPDAGAGQAMLFRNYRNDDSDTIPSYFNGLRIQNCLIKDSQRNGIMMWGNWARNNWYPNTNVVIRNNVLDGVPGDGIVPVACDGAMVEYNVMKNCPPTLPSSEACDGIWPFSSDNTIIQYNMVSDHKSKTDGYGFDSDYNCRNSLFQYNLSYNNEGGFLLLCNSGGWTEDWSAGNQGTIVKYNVSINDGIRNFIVKDKKDNYFSPVIHITGPAKNSYIEKNIFYICKKELPEMDKRLVCSDDWRGYADSTFFRYNHIFVEEPTVAFDLFLSTNNFFEENVYTGPLQTPKKGFIKQEGTFDKSVWYNEQDENWNLLVNFLKDKTLLYKGKETSVLDVIGFY